MWNKRWVSIACVLLCGYFFPVVALSELIFRTDDSAKWGSGKGSRLTMAEVDNNFWYLYNLLGMNVETYTATAGQTVFDTTLQFPPGEGLVAVYVNGVRQAPGAYTETDYNTITLSSGLQDGDIVQIMYRSQEGAASNASVAVYNFSDDGGTVGDIVLATIPNDSYIIEAWYDVVVAPASAGAATISFGIETDDATGLKANTAYNDASFAVGIHDMIPDGTAANATTKTTAERSLIMSIGGADLTGGIIRVWYRLLTTR